MAWVDSTVGVLNYYIYCVLGDSLLYFSVEYTPKP